MIEEILRKRKRRSPTKDLEEETDEEPPAKGRRTSRDLMAKKCTLGGVSGSRRRSRKGGVPSATGLDKKVPSQKDSGWKHAGISSYSAAFAAGGFQHGLGYYTTDLQGAYFYFSSMDLTGCILLDCCSGCCIVSALGNAVSGTRRPYRVLYSIAVKNN